MRYSVLIEYKNGAFFNFFLNDINDLKATLEKHELTMNAVYKLTITDLK